MRHRVRSSSSALAVLALSIAAAAFAADTPQQPAQPQMTPEQQAMMAAWEKAMTPGPQHQKLMAHAGAWTVTTRMWETPGAAPQESTGTSERAAILGGRVLSEHAVSTFMGMPFEGLGWTGYDNVSGQYWGAWIDTFGTGMMTMVGSCNAEATRCEFKGSYNDPISGKAKISRMVTEYPDADREVSRFYDLGPDGKEFQSMEMTYTRQR